MRSYKRRFLIVFICTVLLLCGFIAYQNRTLVQWAVNDLIYSPASFVSELKFISYWISNLTKREYSETKHFRNYDSYYEENNDRLNELDQGILAWHRGYFNKAIEHLESYHRNNKPTESSLFWLAMSYFRLAEAENCLSMLLNREHHHDIDHSKMCTLPIEVHHKQKEYNLKAAKLFEQLLDTYDDENQLWRWLLNVAYMTIDGFPQDVPPKYLIQSPFISHFYDENVREDIIERYGHIKFKDEATHLNADILGTGKGVAVEDFDMDGYLDIVAGSNHEGLRYLRNNEGTGFVDETKQRGLDNIMGVHIISAADYNNDGWVDLFVGRPEGTPLGDFILLRNENGKTFTNVTQSTGLLKEEKERTKRILPWSAAWGDIDNDGDLDLFVCNSAILNPVDWPRALESSRLYINDKNNFIDKTKEYGLDNLTNKHGIFGAAFGDYNNDGYVDLFLTNVIRNKAALLKNVRGTFFEKVSAPVPLEPTFAGTSFLDINHDGLLDIFSSGIGLAEPSTSLAIFGDDDPRKKLGHYFMLVQNKEGNFELNDLFKDQMPLGSMGVNFGDLNNDGAYDFYIGTGSPEGWYVSPNLMFIGEVSDGHPTGYMENISALNDVSNIQKGHGIIFFDFDNDGDQDIYSVLGGMWESDIWPNQLLVNHSDLDNSWVKIRLKGKKNNFYGLGSKIKVVAENPEGKEIVRHYHMDNQTGFGSAPYLAHIGLLDADHIKRVEVTWLGQTKPTVHAASLGKLNILTEDGETIDN